jgi:hypothetical protein
VLAICFTVALFGLWLVVGRALLALLPARRGALQELLLAPAVGLALTLLLLFGLNRLGLPVRRFAWPLTAALPLAAGLALWRLRPQLPLRRYLPFAGLLLAGLWLSGRPLLEYGSDWVSICNDDMANYCLGGQHFLDHGYFELPDEQELVGGRDYGLFYYFLHVTLMERGGSQLVLAWAAHLAGRNCLQVFMPLLLALHLVLLSAAAGLVCRRDDRAWPALLAGALLALSALNTLGVVFQLMSQVFGLALLAAGSALLFRPFADVRPREAVHLGLLGGLTVAALALAYPEVLPFFGVGIAGYVVVSYRGRTMADRPLLIAAVVALLLVGAYLNRFGRSPLQFLLLQITRTEDPVAAQGMREIFPYYLVPSGPAALWGLLPFGGGDLPGAGLSARLVLGACLLLAAAVTALVLAWRGEPVALVAVVMLAVTGVLRWQANGFGLFKMAMFLQPFLLGTLAVAACRLARRPLLHAPPLLLLAAAGLPTQQAYVQLSRGVSLAFTNVPDPSRSHIHREFGQLIRSAPPLRQVVLDSCNSSLLKFQALYLKGIATAVPGYNCFVGIMPRREVLEQLDLRFLGADGLAALRALRDAWGLRAQFDTRYRFDLHDPGRPGAADTFKRNKVGRGEPGPGSYLAASTGDLSVLNRRRFPPGRGAHFALLPWEEVHDHLVLTISELGKHYFYNISGKPAALYPLEPDPMLPGRAMAGCGDHLLFEVLRPSPRFRLLLDFQTTVKGDGENRLPPAAAVGARRESFPVVGRGSARCFSPPLEPQWIDGSAYVALDMQAEAGHVPDRRSGLMRLFGTDLPLDPRRMVAFLRDVSVVSEEEYARLRPPARLEHFPADLLHPDLEYSGVYEDGWLSEASFFRLTAPAGPAEVVVRGVVPLLAEPAFRSELRVLVDGQEVARRQLGLGAFEVTAAVPPGPAARRVELRFSHFQRLPAGDGRPCAARLEAVGFRAGSPLVRGGR